MAAKRKMQSAKGRHKSNNVDTGHSQTTAQFSRSGRPLKKPKKNLDKSFVDSTLPFSDVSSDEASIHTNDDEGIVVRPRRRNLSKTPELPVFEPNYVDKGLISSEDEKDWSGDDSDDESIMAPSTNSKLRPIKLNLTIPDDPIRRCTIILDPQVIMDAAMKQARPRPSTEKKVSIVTAAPTRKPPDRDIIWNAGMIGRLPTELRHKIFLQMFRRGSSALSLAYPRDDFSLSAAALRTCRLIYQEGRVILYSQNSFIIDRRNSKYGSLWTSEWTELDYQPSRFWMKMIGPHNIALLRKVTLNVWDALPSEQHHNRDSRARKAVNNEILLSVMKDLARYGELRELEIKLRTRSLILQSSPEDFRFVNILTHIRADEVTFANHISQNMYVRNGHVQEWRTHLKTHPLYKEFADYCLGKMERKKRLYPFVKKDKMPAMMEGYISSD